jgi:hypothetical protein
LVGPWRCTDLCASQLGRPCVVHNFITVQLWEAQLFMSLLCRYPWPYPIGIFLCFPANFCHMWYYLIWILNKKYIYKVFYENNFWQYLMACTGGGRKTWIFILLALAVALSCPGLGINKSILALNQLDNWRI